MLLSTVTDPLLGTIFAGRYTVLTRIAQGGMGVVYRAHCRRTGRECALKIARSDRDPRRLAACLAREARLARRVRHPGVVAMYEDGVAGDRAYLTMAFIGGQTLETVLAERIELPLRVALNITIQLCEALAAVHAAGLVHRDVKPANIMIDRGALTLLDFGLTRLLSDREPQMLCGTLAYAPPERIRGVTADTRDDIYAVGTILYEMLSGHSAFPERVTQVLSCAFDHHPPALPSWVPPSVQKIVEAMMAPEREVRPSSCAELADQLRAALRRRVSPARHKMHQPNPGVVLSVDAHPLGRRRSSTS